MLMKESSFQAEAYYRFYQELNAIEFFPAETDYLQEYAARLAQCVSRLVPVDHAVLVRMDGEGCIRDSALWVSRNSSGGELCEKLYGLHLNELVKPLWTGDQVSSEELGKRAAVFLEEEEFPYYPVMTPVCYMDKVIGAFIFSKTRERGEWTAEEMSVVDSLTGILSLTLANRNYLEEHDIRTWVFNNIMDNMKVGIYVTDVETDRILFMNKAMKNVFGLEHPEGKTCYMVLQKGKNERCEFCPVPSLKTVYQDHPDQAVCLWEECNTVTGRMYENFDCIMPWLDGSPAHFQQSMDITDSRMLTEAANMDDLTAMLNRRAGRQALARTMAEAKDAGEIFTLCMYDVNDLKEVNDAYGHREGDILLKTIAGAVKQVLEPDDYSFRLSGDEFLIIFRHFREPAAMEKIRQIRAVLKRERKEEGKPYEIGFCCGLLEVHPERSLLLQDVLNQADERMYEQKRLFHIRKAENTPISCRQESGDRENFTYDNERLYDALVQSTDDYVYVCNMETGTFRYPRAMVEEFDLPGEIVSNAAAVWGEKIHPSDKQAFLEANQDIADGHTNCHQVEYRAKNRNGEWVWMRCRGHLEREEHGKPVLFAGMISNLGKRRRIDHMTGLPDKYECEQEVNHLILMRPNHVLGMMILGIDDLKHINDLYSREFGDEVIRIAAQRIRTLLPVASSMYRLDGDMFCIAVQDGGIRDFQRLYDTIQSTFARQQEFNGKKYYSSLSAGAAFYPQDGIDYGDLSKYAEYSLEYAKNNGKNRLVFFSQRIMVHKTRLLDLTEKLRGSVEHDFRGFHLHYQVQVQADNGMTKGAEALARWSDDGSSAGPDEFIPILEASGLIHPVGKWIFKTAVEDCARWVRMYPDFTMSINLSYLQLSDPGLIPFMTKTLEQAGVDSSRIIVELTESMLVSDVHSLNSVFDEIRQLGMRIAMDDFGTGYSSLGVLKNAPADIVKIDRAFVKDILSSSFDSTFIRFVVELCHDVGILVCLEGVETKEEYEIVRSMGLDFIQGYFFGKPADGGVFEENYLKR